jgi:2Fe-2S ferredoxin
MDNPISEPLTRAAKIERRMPKVTYVEVNGTVHEANLPTGLTVMEGARRDEIPGIDADCGGACSCGTCHVYVDEAWVERVGPPGANEKDMLELAVDVRPNSRLSCQIQVRPELDGLIVHLPTTQR